MERKRGKTQGVIAGIMSVVLAVGLMPLPAFAANPSGGGSITSAQFNAQSVTDNELKDVLQDPSRTDVTVSTTDKDKWTAETDDNRTTIATNAESSDFTVTVPGAGWLLFDFRYDNGAWNDKITWTVYNASDEELSGGNSQAANSSTYKDSWTDYYGSPNTKTIALPDKAAKVTWTIERKSDTFKAYFDNVAYVGSEGVAVSVSGDENMTATAKVSGEPVTTVNPGTTVTFSATANTGYVFGGWKTGGATGSDVDKTPEFTEKVFSTPVSYYAYSAKPFDGSGTEQDPFKIAKLADLNALSNYVGKGLDFDGIYFKVTTSITASSNDTFSTIGYISQTGRNYFKGVFDGGGNTIDLSALTLNTGGLFASINGENAALKNLNLKINTRAGGEKSGSDSSVGNIQHIGLAVAYVSEGLIENVTVIGDLTFGTYGNTAGYGGIVGCLSQGADVKNCSYEGTITPLSKGNTDPNTGGIAGNMSYNSDIVNCSFKGTINGSNGASTLGGILGKCSSASTASIQNCSVDAVITGAQHIGGIAGYLDGSSSGGVNVSNCTVAGKITGTGDNVGGIAGYSHPGKTDDGTVEDSDAISNCAVSAAIEGMGPTGGIAGIAYDGGYYVNNVVTSASIKGAADKTHRIAGDTGKANYSSGGSPAFDKNYAAASVFVNSEAVESSDATSLEGADIAADKFVAIPEGKSAAYTAAAQTGVAANNDAYELAGTTSATNAGDYTATATLKDGLYWADGTTAAKTIEWSITPLSLANATVALAKASAAYTGKNQSGSVASVKVGAVTLGASDYTVSAASGKKVGSYAVTVTAKGGNVTGTKATTFSITKAKNTATAKSTSVKSTLKVNKKTKKLAKAATVALPKVTTKFGTATWSITGKDKKGVLSLKSNKVQVKKGAKKGTYTLKLTASVKGTSNYAKASTKAVTVKVTLK